MDSYRVEKQALQKLQLPDDEDAEIGPSPSSGWRTKALRPSSTACPTSSRASTSSSGRCSSDADRVARRFREDIAPQGCRRPRVTRMPSSTRPQTARIEHDKALAKVMLELLKDDTEVYKQFVENAWSASRTCWAGPWRMLGPPSAADPAACTGSEIDVAPYADLEPLWLDVMVDRLRHSGHRRASLAHESFDRARCSKRVIGDFACSRRRAPAARRACAGVPAAGELLRDA
jgi:hypothetical protein